MCRMRVCIARVASSFVGIHSIMFIEFSIDRRIESTPNELDIEMTKILFAILTSSQCVVSVKRFTC